MRVLTIGLLCGALLMSGCTRQEVNDLSVFDYKAGDDACLIALKTTGNFIPWVGEAVVLGVALAGAAAWGALSAQAGNR